MCCNWLASFVLFICNLVTGKVTESALALQVEVAIERSMEQTLASHLTQVANVRD